MYYQDPPIRFSLFLFIHGESSQRETQHFVDDAVRRSAGVMSEGRARAQAERAESVLL